jgi:hypothetical protein
MSKRELEKDSILAPCTAMVDRFKLSTQPWMKRMSNSETSFYTPTGVQLTTRANDEIETLHGSNIERR